MGGSVKVWNRSGDKARKHASEHGTKHVQNLKDLAGSEVVFKGASVYLAHFFRLFVRSFIRSRSVNPINRAASLRRAIFFPIGQPYRPTLSVNLEFGLGWPDVWRGVRSTKTKKKIHLPWTTINQDFKYFPLEVLSSFRQTPFHNFQNHPKNLKIQNLAKKMKVL